MAKVSFTGKTVQTYSEPAQEREAKRAAAAPAMALAEQKWQQQAKTAKASEKPTTHEPTALQLFLARPF